MLTPDIKALSTTLTETEFTKGKTTFRIERLNPMEGYHLLDTMRNMIGAVTSEAWETSPQAFLVSALGKLPHDDLEYIRNKLFERVQFTRADTAPTARPLAGSEDIAFEGLDAGIVYEVIVRAFAVNFTAILLRIQDGLKAGEKTSKQSSLKQSRPSLRPRSRRK